MYKGCAADIAVTCPLRDVYARLADGMSPADHYSAAEKHSKYDEGFVGFGVTFCSCAWDIWWSVNRGHGTLQTVGVLHSRVAPHCAGPFKALC